MSLAAGAAREDRKPVSAHDLPIGPMSATVGAIGAWASAAPTA
jgi:hypothetical protein